jgi:hypoxanthine phosphoribosyltransferase
MKKLISEKQLKIIVKNLGSQITNDYQNTKELIVVGLLKGSFIFMADLIREIKLPLKTEFMQISSYHNNQQTSEVKIILDLNTSIFDKDVLVVEDIIDTGRTFSKVLELLRSRNPKSLKTCVLLDKEECRVIEQKVDYCGKKIKNLFVVGYGLDNNQFDRNLPFVGNI